MTETNSKIDEAFDMIQTDPEESLANFDEILKKYPNNIIAINGKATAYMKLNKISQAEELFDQSMEIKPTTTALLNKGLIAKKRENYEDALKYFNRANYITPRMKNITFILKNEVFDCIDLEDDNCGLTLFNKEVNLLIKKGLEYKKVDKYWDSLECYESAIQKDANVTQYIDSLIHEINIIIENKFLFKRPTHEDTPLSQMRIEGLQKLLLEANPTEAMSLFNRVLKIDSRDIDTLNYKAIILFNQNKYSQAIKFFDKCLSIDENYHYALFNKSLVLLRIKSFKDAVICFKKLLNNPESYHITKKYDSEDIKKINQTNI